MTREAWVQAASTILLLVITIGTPLAVAREYLIPFVETGNADRAFPDAITYLAAAAVVRIAINLRRIPRGRVRSSASQPDIRLRVAPQPGGCC